jgi:LuxR family maltose regulon positive regulatory protein
LHLRASHWYAKHHQITQAIQHALRAQEWQWAVDLIEQERLPFLSFTWGGVEHELARLKEWLEQLPVEVMRSHPQLYLACAQILWQVAPPQMLQAWLDAAEEAAKTWLISQTQEQVFDPILASQAWQNQENVLGEVIGWHALLRSIEEDSKALTLCQQALALLSADNMVSRSLIAIAQSVAYLNSSANDAMGVVESARQATFLAQATGQAAIATNIKAVSVMHLTVVGQLHEAERLARQAIDQAGATSALVGWPTIALADVMREWNKLDTALSLAEGAISLCKQINSMVSLINLHYGCQILLRIYLSRRDLDAAYSVFQDIERIDMILNKPVSRHISSYSFMSDQVRLWQACGQRDRAIHWAKKRERCELEKTPFTQERGEVAHARVLLAVDQSHLALQRLEPTLQRATQGRRWRHVIEIRLLQALAYQMCQQNRQALDALREAVRLGEPEGYIRSFVDEGTQIEALLYQLRKHDRRNGPTPYLDTLLAAFQQECMAHAQGGEPSKVQRFSETLSERELQVLQLLADGASNQEIAQELVIAYDTVKRHISHIFSKLGVKNRVQAVRQARELGLLGEAN